MLDSPKIDDGDDFDVAVEDAIARPSSKRTKTDPSAKKKKKFGSKAGRANPKKSKQKTAPKRPGKRRRIAARKS
jgi:hypothetical protein